MNKKITGVLAVFLFAVLMIGLLAGTGCQLIPALEWPSLPELLPAPTPAPSQLPDPITPTRPSTSSSPVPATPIEPAWKPPSQISGTLSPMPSFAPIIRQVSPSLVSIQTESVGLNNYLQAVPREGAGSGVIVDARGYVVTNNHVVEGAKTIKVNLNDGRVFDAVTVNRDPWTDLAVVQIKADNLPVAKLGRSENLQVGDWVVAIGNALALDGGATVTQGIVSYLGRSIQEPNGVTLYNLIQTDAAINPGNSGGALLNMAGEVVGINVAIAGDAQNIGFAISITPALPVIEQLITQGKVSRGYMGIEYQALTAAIVARYNLQVKEGAYLNRVVAGSPADKAGLKAGDVVTVMDGRKILKTEDLRLAIQARRPGETVELTYNRAGTEYKTRITLGEAPSTP
jgi:S1-C subfamily serine protease